MFAATVSGNCSAMEMREHRSQVGRGASGFQVTLRSDGDAAHEARRQVNGLADLLPVAVLADLRTIVSELVTNCVRHGTGREIEVTVAVARDGSVRGSVGDGGVAPVEIGPPQSAFDAGLGLRIVDALVTRWGVHAPSSDVWFELAPVVDAAPNHTAQ
jgi:anti-sigma regulatory factor (Ser/Thr protein kinase)